MGHNNLLFAAETGDFFAVYFHSSHAIIELRLSTVGRPATGQRDGERDTNVRPSVWHAAGDGAGREPVRQTSWKGEWALTQKDVGPLSPSLGKPA